MTACKALGWLRAYVFTIALVYVATLPLEQFAAFPAALHEQVGVARLLPSSLWAALHERFVLTSVKIVLVAGLAACALGLGPYRLLAPASVALFVLHQCLIRIDKSGHGELALLNCLLVLAAFPAADAVALSSRPRNGARPQVATYSLALLLAAFVFLFTYAAPAVYRLAHAAPEIFRDGSMARYVVANGSELRNGTSRFTWGASLVAMGPLAVSLLNVSFVVATLAEALSPLALVNRSFRWGWLAFCLMFHGANLLLLNIAFTLNMVLLPALLIALEFVHDTSQPGDPVAATA